MNLNYKYCSGGHLEILDQFNKDKYKKDGLCRFCKECGKIKSKEYREKNKEKLKEKRREKFLKEGEKIREQKRNNREKHKDSYNLKMREKYKENRDEILDRRKIYREKNKERIKEQNKIYRENNKEKRRETDKKYRENNREKINAYRRKYVNERRRNDESFRLRYNICDYLLKKLKKYNLKKTNSTLTYLGCDMEFFRRHISSFFTEEMSWDNYGKVWEIDHTIPCASWDHTDDFQLFCCWNYRNLRPMIKEENRSKGDNFSGDKKMKYINRMKKHYSQLA